MPLTITFAENFPNDPYDIVVLMAEIREDYLRCCDHYEHSGVIFGNEFGWHIYSERIGALGFYPHGTDLRADLEAIAWAKNPGLGLKCSILFQELFGDPEIYTPSP